MNEVNDNEKINLIKNNYSWLSNFNLSDQQFYDLDLLVTRVLIGSDELGNFYDKLLTILGKDFNQSEASTVASMIFKHYFIPNEEDLKDVLDWAKKFNLNIPGLEVEISNDIFDKLNNYDWSNINDLEKYAILEDLGISLNQFKKWQDNNYGK